MEHRPVSPVTELRSGFEIPSVGLGVFRSRRGDETRDAVLAAFERGYRHVDTARIYGNEADVGAAIRASTIARDQLFVTTKLWNDDHGYDAALRAFDASLSRLGLDYVDLYLVHWPVPELRNDSWRALEKLHRDGRARSIGVSNFMEHHLDELFSRTSIVPHVNQIEVHPFHQQRGVRELCAARGIVVEAYSPLAKASRLSDPVVLQVARSVGRTPAQVLLRWGLQRSMVVLPKSVRPGRIEENIALYDFSLDDDALAKLDALDEGASTGWDPRRAP